MAFSAVTNNDKVGLLAFTDQVELHIPPRKGRSHVLRMIRDLLAFEPVGSNTDITMALDRLNHTLKRRAIIFLISDFLTDYRNYEVLKAYERMMQVTNRRHDLVAVSITDPRETKWPNAGLTMLQDAETGSKLWIDSGNRSWRDAFAQQAFTRCIARDSVFTKAQIDHVPVTVGEDYVLPLLNFFKTRAHRWRR